MNPRWFWLCFFLGFGGMLSGGQNGSLWGAVAPESANPPSPSSFARRKAFAIKVGKSRVTLDQVFDVWGGTWYEIMAKIRAGKLSGEEGDIELQRAWVEALETMTRNEIFYAEAKRKMESQIRTVINQVAARQGGGGYHGSSPGRIEREIRERYRKGMERQLEVMIDNYVRASGGAGKLKQVITARGFTWVEWRERLLHRVFSDAYLQMVISPLVPRQVRPIDVRRYYKAHPAEFRTADTTYFRHILFANDKRGGADAARAAAGKVYDEILDGKISFKDAARKYSDDPVSRERGGLETDSEVEPDREAWLADVRDAVREEKVGVLGPILASPIGYHLVVLISIKNGQPIPFSQAQKTIISKFKSERWEKELQRLYKRLKGQIRIKILEPHFPAELSWEQVSKRLRKSSQPIYQIGAAARPGVQTHSTETKNLDKNK